jgi:Microtubule-Associated protein Jupiter
LITPKKYHDECEMKAVKQLDRNLGQTNKNIAKVGFNYLLAFSAFLSTSSASHPTKTFSFVFFLRVLKPPGKVDSRAPASQDDLKVPKCSLGGGSSDIFSVSDAATPRSIKNHMRSNIFAAPSPLKGGSTGKTTAALLLLWSSQSRHCKNVQKSIKSKQICPVLCSPQYSSSPRTPSLFLHGYNDQERIFSSLV